MLSQIRGQKRQYFVLPAFSAVIAHPLDVQLISGTDKGRYNLFLSDPLKRVKPLDRLADEAQVSGS